MINIDMSGKILPTMIFQVFVKAALVGVVYCVVPVHSQHIPHSPFLTEKNITGENRCFSIEPSLLKEVSFPTFEWLLLDSKDTHELNKLS